MRRQSQKRAATIRVYMKKRTEFLANNPWCGRCGHLATEVHHKEGRVGLLLLDDTRWMAVCHPCHVWITDNPVESYNSGWSLRRIHGGDVA